MKGKWIILSIAVVVLLAAGGIALALSLDGNPTVGQMVDGQGIEVRIDASQTEVQQGENVTLTIEQENTGNVTLSEAYVELNAREVAYEEALNWDHESFTGGDENDNNMLDPGETWMWEVEVPMTETTTFFAIGHGTADGTPVESGGVEVSVTVPTPEKPAEDMPGTEVAVSASADMVQSGDNVTLTITETNSGNVTLSSAYVELMGDDMDVEYEPAGALDDTHASLTSDMNDDDMLEPGETWTWTVDVTVNETTTFVAIGHGMADGTDITYDAYPAERAEVTVEVEEEAPPEEVTPPEEKPPCGEKPPCEEQAPCEQPCCGS